MPLTAVIFAEEVLNVDGVAVMVTYIPIFGILRLEQFDTFPTSPLNIIFDVPATVTGVRILVAPAYKLAVMIEVGENPP